MPRESVTIQCYPSDNEVNNTIASYERFGWELVSNQRCQEFTGQTSYSDGSSTEHYSTFVKLTFSRDKDAKWYKEVASLEQSYYNLREEYQRLQRTEPSSPRMNGWLFLPCLFFPPIIIAVLPLALILHMGKKKKYKTALSKWETETAGKFQDINNEIKSVLARADNAIAG